MVKKGNFNRNSLKVLFQNLSILVYRPLFEVEFYFVSEHLPDDPDKFSGAMSKGIVVCPAFGSLGVVISLESRIVLYNIMSCVHKGVTKYT